MTKRRAWIVCISLATTVLIIAVGIGIFVYTHLQNQPHYLEVSFLDVGQGDAIFIEAPNHKQILIDGGPDASVLTELGTVMPWYDRSIDMVIATHMDRDHIGGLHDVLLYYDVDYIGTNGTSGTTSTADTFHELILDENAENSVLRTGKIITIDAEEDIYIEILWPDDAQDYSTNDGSIVILLVYGQTEFLLTGDISSEIENNIIDISNKDMKADVLKVSHHGSKYSSSSIFLDALDVELAIISVGCDNPYGHPAEVVIDRLYSYAVEYISTCDEGTITLQSDGTNIYR